MLIDSDVCMLGCAMVCVRTCSLSWNRIGAEGAGSLATSLCALTGLTTLEYVYAYAWSRVRRQWNVGSMVVLLCERLFGSQFSLRGHTVLLFFCNAAHREIILQREELLSLPGSRRTAGS